MIIEVKLFATLRLKLKTGMVKVNINEPFTVLQLLHIVSDKLESDIIPELIENDKIMIGTIILIDGYNVLHMNKLETLIDKDCTVSLFPPNGGG